MSRTATVRKYGKQSRRPRADLPFAEPPPPGPAKPRAESEDPVSKLADQLTLISLGESSSSGDRTAQDEDGPESPARAPEPEPAATSPQKGADGAEEDEALRVLTWDDVCPPGDRIEKIAEASYAEVYRVRNERGTSIIKVMRLQSPIRPQTKAQQRAGLVDEEPHRQEDLRGELRISEWLADIPGFVVYKERYVVGGRAPKDLLETHQTFHRRAKRRDPGRIQFYPSPSRYLDDTRFLVVELGDAGTALEDFSLVSISQVWDIFLHVAIALARAEDQIKFEVRGDAGRGFFPLTN